ncbi:hypothetical protein HYC85_030154 [Camellia sinensis]|uniref:Uncharacterized protein n=1 Tax=Camellia sinensis TaxID=4442 RepID=A0A7J7FZX2_CAMSI|nr:hypothetical protein HYC85_030154 [Camellia sinensis]
MAGTEEWQEQSPHDEFEVYQDESPLRATQKLLVQEWAMDGDEAERHVRAQRRKVKLKATKLKTDRGNRCITKPGNDLVVGLPFFESQGKWIAELLSGKRTLPSRDVMMHSIMEFYHQRNVDGIPKYRTHDIGNFESRSIDHNRQVTINETRYGDNRQYSDEYADHTGFPHLEEWRKELSLSAIINSYVNLETYRDSYEHDLHLLQLTLQDPYFTQLRPQDAKLSIN